MLTLSFHFIIYAPLPDPRTSSTISSNFHECISRGLVEIIYYLHEGKTSAAHAVRELSACAPAYSASQKHPRDALTFALRSLHQKHTSLAIGLRSACEECARILTQPRATFRGHYVKLIMPPARTLTWKGGEKDSSGIIYSERLGPLYECNEKKK